MSAAVAAGNDAMIHQADVADGRTFGRTKQTDISGGGVHRQVANLKPVAV